MKFHWLSLFLMVVGVSVHASEQLTTDNIWTAIEKTESLAKKHGPSHVVFVSDLDNTLLKTNQDLASEPWFNWQDGLVKEGTSDLRIACDMPDLLHFFYITISLSQLSPVQNDQAQAIERLQKAKIPAIILTARGEGVASATFRELSRNDLDFSKTGLGGTGFTNPHLPYDINNPESAGLTQKDIAKFGLKESRPVLYQRGVHFSDGQNKGILLRALIHKLKKNIKGIVFFDNDKKNTQRMFDAYEGLDTELYSIRASRMDTDIQRFNDSDKTKVTNDYVVLRKVLDDTYSYPRPCQLPIDLTIRRK